MSKYSRYKVNASDLGDLMSREPGTNPPTENELNKFLKILEKDSIDITEIQRQNVLDIVSKGANATANSVSGTMRKILHKHYAYAEFGLNKVHLTNDVPTQFEKGEIAEPDAIKLLSAKDGVSYSKNEKLFSNKFFKGIPDIVLEENGKIVGVKDVKIPSDFINFLSAVEWGADKGDIWEMRAYLDILDLPSGEICYCLVNMPEQVRKKKLDETKNRMELMGFEPTHINKRLRQISKSMNYDHIPDDQKIIRITVERRAWFTKDMRSRVKIVRDRLLRLDEKFKNLLHLGKITGPLPEDMS